MDTQIIAYGAGPVDLVQMDKDVAIEWRNLIIDAAGRRGMSGIVMFDPSAPFLRIADGHPGGGAMARYIEDVNWCALVASHCCIALVTRKVLTVGTVVEIDIAAKFRIPTILITDVPYGTSVYLDNRVPPDRRVPIRDDFSTTVDDTVSLLHDVVEGPDGARMFAETDMRQANMRSQLRNTCVDFSTHIQDTIVSPRVVPATRGQTRKVTL